MKVIISSIMKKCICFILVICTVSASACSNKKEVSQEVLDLMQLMTTRLWGLCYMLAVHVEGYYYFDAMSYKSEIIAEAGENTLVATIMTERFINLLNFYIFDYPSSENLKDKEVFSQIDSLFGNKLDYFKGKLTEYGITADNRLTVEWVMENQEDSYLLFDEEHTWLFGYYMSRLVIENKDFEVFDKVCGLTLSEYEEYNKVYNVVKDNYLDLVDSKKVRQIIENFNNYFFDENNKNQGEEYELAAHIVKSAGFSEENPMTLYWVMDYPYEAYHLMKALPDSVREEIFTVPDL